MKDSIDRKNAPARRSLARNAVLAVSVAMLAAALYGFADRAMDMEAAGMAQERAERAAIRTEAPQRNAGSVTENGQDEPVADSGIGADALRVSAIDVAPLQEENGAVRGWVDVPGTGISYPVVQGQDNQEYLRSAWDGSYSIAGSIMLDAKNGPDFGDAVTVLYGHNMKDGSMFGCLSSFLDPDFAKEHGAAYVALPDGILEYRFAAAMTVPKDGWIYDTRSSWEEFSENAAGTDLDGLVPADGKCLVLSTCGKDAKQDRDVAVFILERKIEKDAG